MRTTPLSLVGKALSHPIRIEMLKMLADGESCGCEFAPKLETNPSVVSRYLGLLERVGLITSRREGVRVMWRLASPKVLEVLSELTDLVRAKEIVR